MRNLLQIQYALVLLLAINSTSIFSQIYSAKGGSFIVFQENPDKSVDIRFDTPGINNDPYKWPANENDFIRSYREAEKIITGPTVLTDEDLHKMWIRLEEMPALAPSLQFHPTILLALGQAAFIAGNTPLTSCTISLRFPKSPNQTKTIEWRDHTHMAASTIKSESVKDNGRNIQLKYIFPNDSWIKGAKVYKKTVGATVETEIFPMVFTSTLADRIEMNIRDTMNQAGEFLYTIEPFDYFGNTFTKLAPVYAHNYNQLSAPAFVDFKCDVAEESKSIRMSWNCTVKERVRGFEIYRGLTSNGNFQRIATVPASDSIYIDHVEGVMQNFFYYIQILDQMGDGSKSIIRFVTPLVKEKPQPPIDLIASPDKKGVVLKWPAQDGLYHTRGYYVYRRDRDTTSWTQVSPFIPLNGQIMTYLDTSNQLEAQIEYTYHIRSESTSYLLSDPSVTASSRPGIPREVVTPQDLSYRFMDDGRLMLYWSDQRIYDPYILHYHIYPIGTDGQPGKEVPGSPVGVNQNFWLQPDSLMYKGGYCITSADAWGNVSTCSKAINPYNNQHVIAPGGILVHPTTNGYKLSWGLPQEKTIKSIQLYELNDKEEAFLVKSLTPQTGTFEIPKLKDGQVRSFYLAYKLSDGKESEAGDVVIVSK